MTFLQFDFLKVFVDWNDQQIIEINREVEAKFLEGIQPQTQ